MTKDSGVIVKGIGGFYYVKTQNAVIECRAKGIFRKNEITPMVGDRVFVNLNSDGTGVVAEILPRKNSLVRPAVSNIDQLIIVARVVAPEPDLALIDKLSVIAKYKDIDCALVINKIDLDSNEADKLEGIYKGIFPVIKVSAKDKINLDQFKKLLDGKISTLAGLSGAGKSSLLNAVFGVEIQKTGEVSKKIDRGLHTTRHFELIPLDDNTFMLDTPGFSSLDVLDVPYNEVSKCFVEFSKYEDLCFFRGCSHTKEPKCAVKQALEEGKIQKSRYDNYVEIYEKAKEIKEWEK